MIRESEMTRLKDDPSALAVEMLTRLVRITSELFCGDVSLRESCDPEFRDDKYTVLSVNTRLSPEEAAKAERDWVRRVESIAPSWKDLRLTIRFLK
jgi:hypothetical protein